MKKEVKNSIYDINVSPRTLTIITTYTCNAACEECCFECSPHVKHRLELTEIKKVIADAHSKFPELQQVVFTGGECFLLKVDLFKAIKFCTTLGLVTRCVSNGYWGKNHKKAEIIAKQLKSVD